MSRTVHHEFRNAVKLLRKEPAALAVYMIYVSRMDNQAVAFPSIRGLSKDTGWSTRKVQDARTYLTTIGLLTRIENPSDNPMDRRAFYRVNDSFERDGKTYFTLFNGAQVADVRDEKEHMHVLPRSTPRATPSNVDAVAHKVVPELEGNSMPDAIAPAQNGTKAPAKPRKRNAMFDAIVEAFQYDADGLTKNEASLIGTVAAQLTAAQVTPDEVPALYAWCKRQNWKSWGPGALTTNVSNWRKTAKPRPVTHPASDWETFA